MNMRLHATPGYESQITNQIILHICINLIMIYEISLCCYVSANVVDNRVSQMVFKQCEHDCFKLSGFVRKFIIL